MKCVKPKKGGEILRVTAERASELVNKGTHVYVSKHLWKAQKRKQTNTGGQ